MDGGYQKESRKEKIGEDNTSNTGGNATTTSVAETATQRARSATCLGIKAHYADTSHHKEREIGQPKPGRRLNPTELVKRCTHRTKAVTISKLSERETYARVKKRVVAGVDLKEVGINLLGKTRRTKTGAILIEVQGKEVADKLAIILRDAVGEVA